MSFDSTVDPREVEFYSGLADTWWDREGPFWPLHNLNELRIGYIESKLCEFLGRDPGADQPLEGVKVLDIGCGGGLLSESMARRGARVTGIDVVEKNIRVASLHAEQEGLDIDYRLASAGDIANTGEKFDVVLNMEVVEHVADVDAFMRDCARVTADSGAMFVSTINRTPIAWLFAIVGAEYILGWLPRGTHRWSMFRKPVEIREHLQKGGLTVHDIVGVAANPFTRKLRITGSTKVNYMLFCARPAPA